MSEENTEGSSSGVGTQMSLPSENKSVNNTTSVTDTAEGESFLQLLRNLQADIKSLRENQATTAASFDNKQIKRKANTVNSSSKRFKTPQLGLEESNSSASSAPQRVFVQQNTAEEDDYYTDEEFNVHASLSESYDTDFYDNDEGGPSNSINNNLVDLVSDKNENVSKSSSMFSNIRVIKANECKGEKIDPGFAEIINQSWSSRKEKDDVKKLRDTYPTPENCTFKTPKLNVELWHLLNSLQRKSDVKMSMVQRNINAAASAALSVAKDIINCPSKKYDVQKLLQKTTDMIALLGHASSEISMKRKLFVRSVLKEEYQDLVSVTPEVTDKLFGDNLSQSIKDINLRNKLSYKNNNNKNKSYRKAYEKDSYRSQRSFLGKGRGRMSSSNNRYHKKGAQK